MAVAALPAGSRPADSARGVRVSVYFPKGDPGYGGWFSRRTAGMLRSVRIAASVAYVDFRDFRRIIPNASSSCGSALLLAQLNRTATQFASVDRTVYSIDGSRRAFYEWLQRSAP